MIISTYLAKGAAGDNFQSWKRKSAGDWSHALTGEWSTMSGSSGNRYFLCRHSVDCTYWALKLGRKIVAVAHTPDNADLEVVVGAMLRQLEADGGEWIEAVYDAPDGFDLDKFWSAFQPDANV